MSSRQEHVDICPLSHVFLAQPARRLRRASSDLWAKQHIFVSIRVYLDDGHREGELMAAISRHQIVEIVLPRLNSKDLDLEIVLHYILSLLCSARTACTSAHECSQESAAILYTRTTASRHTCSSFISWTRAHDDLRLIERRCSQ